MTKELSFHERFYEEYDLRGRVRLTVILSCIFYPMFILLDAVILPDLLVTLAIIRFLVLGLNLAILLTLKSTETSRGLLNLGMLLLIVDALGIALMVQLMGGFMSSYYQGLTVVLMAMMTLLPFALRESVIVSVILWLSYCVPSMIFVQRDILDFKIVINNLFFLSSIVVIGLFASHGMYNIRRRALKSRIRLESLSMELQESNEKLKSLDEIKNQFFANVNHELRTPLTLMLAPIGPILEGQMGRVTAKQKSTLIMIKQNGFRLLKLINNLLDLSKLEEGKMRLKIKTLDFIEYINSLLASVRPLADRREILLYFQHPSTELEITIDPDHFEKVVLNLLSNALKFTQEQGRITVYLEEKENSVTLVVEDSGVGIPRNKLKSIFDRFSQVDGSLSRMHAGTGIGLSLAKEIVQIHGGKIRVESEEGKGSRFYVNLKKGKKHYGPDVLDRRVDDRPPTIKKRADDQDCPKPQDIVTNFRDLQMVDLDVKSIEEEDVSKTTMHDHILLVIDDNPEVLKLMQMLLKGEFDLLLSQSAEQGLKIMRAKSPDLVVCDVMMPGMNGYAFLEQVRNDDELKHTPVILVTARAGADMLAEGIKFGANDYITKPFNSEELKARIGSLLKMRKVEVDLARANRILKMRTSDLEERQRSLFLSTVKSLVSALDAKDKYTRDHSTRVTEFTLKIAENMNIDHQEMKDLELAALLHDVGKIAVPESILNKVGRLTDDEFAKIKEHPGRGEDILKPVIELLPVTRIVRAHHERYDGKGYPDGLRGLGIPVGARIMAVADTYDAITSDRPYRNGQAHNFAVKEIVKCAGSQFDPEVVEQFIEIADKFAEIKSTGTGSAA